MKNISLASYTLRIKERGSNTYAKVNNFGLSKLDLFSIITNFLNNISSNWSHDSEERRIIQLNNMTSGGRIIVGSLLYGSYGYMADLRDINSQNMNYIRQINDVELLPYYILISLPVGKDEGIVIFEKKNNQGIKTYFVELLKNFFNALDTNYVLEINELVPLQVLRQMTNDGINIKSITFRKFGLPQDIADYFSGRGFRDTDGIYDVTIKAYPRGVLNYLGSIINRYRKKESISDFVELINFEPTEVKITVKVNGKNKTLNLADPDHIRGQIDITDRVVFNDNTGHPRFSDLDREARDLLTDLETELYGEQELHEVQQAQEEQVTLENNNV